MWSCVCFLFFFFNDTATTEIYTLSLHDALPIYVAALQFGGHRGEPQALQGRIAVGRGKLALQDRKSTRLNSSHSQISYAVFCLKKKKNKQKAPSLLSQCHTRYEPPPLTNVLPQP